MRAVPSRWLLLRIATASTVCAPASVSESRGPLDAPLGGPAGVVADAVGDLGCGDAVAVHQRGRELHPVPRVGEVLAQHDPTRAPAEAVAHVAVVVGAERRTAAQAERDRERSPRGREAPAGAAHEPAAGVGAAELERLDLPAEVALPAAQVVVEVALDHRARVHHEPTTDEPRRIGQAVRRARMGRQQQQAGGADAVRGAEHDVGTLEGLTPVGIEPRHAAGPTARIDLDLPHARAGAQLRTGRQCPGPVRDIGGALRPLVAPEPHVPRCTHAWRPSRVGREDGVVLRPPVPPESRVCPSEREAGAADRERRQGWIRAGRVRRVATEAGHTELAIGLFVVGQQLLVRQRPVVADPEVGAGAEVGRQQARPDRVVQDRAPADAVEVAEHHVGVVEVQRVVGRAGAQVGRRRPLLPRQELPVGAGSGVVVPVRPVALLEAHDAQARTRQAECGDAARRPGADDHDVGVLAHGVMRAASCSASSCFLILPDCRNGRSDLAHTQRCFGTLYADRSARSRARSSSPSTA